MKVFYYAKRLLYNALPSIYFSWKYRQLKEFEKSCNQVELQERLNYYNRLNSNFPIPQEAIAIKNYKRTKGTDYYLDLKEFLQFFKSSTQFAYRFGDETKVNTYPTLVKARPIDGDVSNSVLFKLNKNRHFKWVNDLKKFEDKENLLVWRGGAYKNLRRNFVEQFYNHPKCNVKQTNKPIEEVPWQGKFLSIEEQLKYKFIFCPEGNDVATNLKWVMSSNSLAFMPKPKYETWFMEGTLVAGKHYVEIKDDYSDLEEKINYYSTHTNEAKTIIQEAHKHVEKFQNKLLEDLLCLKVLEQYTQLSGQNSASKFTV